LACGGEIQPFGFRPDKDKARVKTVTAIAYFKQILPAGVYFGETVFAKFVGEGLLLKALRVGDAHQGFLHGPPVIQTDALALMR
jgi:hypothetical protein